MHPATSPTSDAATARSETDAFGQRLYAAQDQQIVAQVTKVAAARGGVRTPEGTKS